MAIIQSGGSWQFGSEYELEETVWKNLKPLLNLTPFKRQYSVRGQFCDILALDAQQRLVVIELKNAEDRYVVQQLTRYYDALVEEKPFQADLNLKESIRLIAIAPIFHRDTLIDCKYHGLKFELYTFKITSKNNALQLQLTYTGTNETSLIRLAQTPDLTNNAPTTEIADPPRKLLNWLSHSAKPEFDGFLQARKQILSFDSRMKEIIESQKIIYGRGKTKPCAEIRMIKLIDDKEPALFLWLPDLEDKPHVLRMQLVIDKNWEKVAAMGYSPSSTKIRRIWNFPQCIEYMQRIRYKNSLKLYKKVMSADRKACLPPRLIDFALETWKARF